MLKFQNLSKSFRSQNVLQNLSFEILRGERVVLTGHNGSGKTTLIRCLLGLYNYKGSILVSDSEPRRDRQLALSQIAFVPQTAPLFKNTVGDMLEFAARFSQCKTATVSNFLERMNQSLEPLLKKSFVSLSGGMKQKVLIAIALARSAQTIIFDEPGANLDPEARHVFYDCLSQLDRKATIILATHRLDELTGLATRSIVLHKGTIEMDVNLRALIQEEI